MPEIQWQKSSFSTEGNECVELARSNESILIRESDTPHSVIAATPEKLRALILGIKSGEFDHLA
ncbi:DUF397 domain-containing protein [Streptomyces pactum]|uniref:DUF397 domain-containing protein n=2 Tax=Streptomyces pactum TaxID=68249 RepID=A0ABS0NLJ9_9ACTN|nr:DUF397 domain-containing protein [Streptomyces pactum]